ncbi:MAG: hypothetical protein A2939_01045 [Parcubacteria group bacterium RIFCSPLOWO2_01_FULL_48_18]|nr:MAG: hypothetical protein A3J67_01335 [Parcubacteria group bacterium RIFCSPHIGHO2_02_FULL_48_10b]OHB22058.1 MAG: hypothetical protein A2939_01045 [Parcubacteria group bacterium RIFCSPLOWO2_01_FULL_48_18]
MNKFDILCDRWCSWAPVFLRVTLAFVFFLFGYQKLSEPSQTTAEIQLLLDAGLGSASVINYYTGLIEVIVGLGLLIGFKVRVLAGVAAVMIAGIFSSILRAYGASINPDIYRDIGLFGAAVALMLLGAGPWSIEEFMNRKKGKPGGFISISRGERTEEEKRETTKDDDFTLPPSKLEIPR